VLAHTQIRKTGLKQKKAHLMEIQVNGGSVADKVEYVQGLFEKSMEVGTDFEQDECDVIAVTKGHGLEGVTHRWYALQPRLTHENGPLTRIMTGTSSSPGATTPSSSPALPSPSAGPRTRLTPSRCGVSGAMRAP
jgi:ribosomal protein L3